MFKENFVRLCAEKGVAPSVVCQQIGLSNAAFSAWDEKSIPRKTTLIKIADYFGVTTETLLTGEKEKPLGEIPEGLSELDAEIIKVLSSLSEERKQQALSYLDFLRKQGGE
jgi:transcriptional regulator with XRE-family HTH domain